MAKSKYAVPLALDIELRHTAAERENKVNLFLSCEIEFPHGTNYSLQLIHHLEEGIILDKHLWNTKEMIFLIEIFYQNYLPPAGFSIRIVHMLYLGYSCSSPRTSPYYINQLVEHKSVNVKRRTYN